MADCPHDLIEPLDMHGKRVVWATDDEPLDPQPPLSQCEECGYVWISLSKNQAQLVAWCTQLGVQHLRLITEEAVSE